MRHPRATRHNGRFHFYLGKMIVLGETSLGKIFFAPTRVDFIFIWAQ
jgi:hypothetical protein